MFAQPCAVLIFNNDMFVIPTAMTEKPAGECIKSAFVTDDNNKAKPIAGIGMAGMIVISALLLSGLSLINSYQPAIAQEEMTGEATAGNATTTNATTTDAPGVNQSEVRLHIEEALTALQNNDTQGALMHLDLALSALGGAAAAVTTEGNMTTATTIAGTNDESNSNTDANRGETDTEQEYSECGGVTVGGTSAADDYGCPPDPDY